MVQFDIDIFKKRLAETVEWCQLRFSIDDKEGSLRTDPQPEKAVFPDIKVLADIATSIFPKRENEFNKAVKHAHSGLADGRLLLTHIGGTTCQVTSGVMTDNFIDDCDLPPWDTWVYCGTHNRRDILISWIPQLMLGQCQSAIEFNADEALVWIENSEPYGIDFLDKLRQAKLLFGIEE